MAGTTFSACTDAPKTGTMESTNVIDIMHAQMEYQVIRNNHLRISKLWLTIHI
jgi:hypothetical protein